MSESRVGGDLITVVTYNKIWFGDLEDMIRKEFDLPYDYRFMAESEMSQDSYMVINPNEVLDVGDDLLEEAYGHLDYVYVKTLMVNGLLPTDNPLFIDVWW